MGQLENRALTIKNCTIQEFWERQFQNGKPTGRTCCSAVCNYFLEVAATTASEIQIKDIATVA